MFCVLAATVITESAPTAFSSESWDSNSGDSDTSDGMVLYFSQLDGRKGITRYCYILISLVYIIGTLYS